jgi:DMSO/TMAO reductase YedYZ molybdopterin-dependent catalytic subunit
MSDDRLTVPKFVGKRRAERAVLPPGQYVTNDFPVLSAGPTPAISLNDWTFSLVTETGARKTWSWQEFRALPSQAIVTDIHCVTRWSKLVTHWEGVPVDTLLEGVETSAEFVMAHSYGGYTTNVPLRDLREGKAWIAFSYDGKDLEPEHGGPARLLVPHLYFWKSAKWVNGLTLMRQDEPGFWEQLGYHMYGDPWKEQRYGGE